MKHSLHQIRVAIKQKQPYKLYHYDAWLGVTDILDRWAYAGGWWSGESEKMFWRLQLEQGQIMEIYQDQVRGDWWLYKVYD